MTFYKTKPWVSCQLLPTLLLAHLKTLQITVTLSDQRPAYKTHGALFNPKTSTCHSRTSFIPIEQHVSFSCNQCFWVIVQLIIKRNIIVKSTDTPLSCFMQRIDFYTYSLAFYCESVSFFSLSAPLSHCPKGNAMV